MEPWPAERTKRSLFIHEGSFPLWFITLDQRVYAAGAAPIGKPGCPDFAFCMPSADNILIVFIVNASLSVIKNHHASLSKGIPFLDMQDNMSIPTIKIISVNTFNYTKIYIKKQVCTAFFLKNGAF